MTDTVLGYFHLDLYRLGNAHRNKIDVLRDRDVEGIRFFRVAGKSDSPVPTNHSGEVE